MVFVLSPEACPSLSDFLRYSRLLSLGAPSLSSREHVPPFGLLDGVPKRGFVSPRRPGHPSTPSRTFGVIARPAALS